MHGRDNDGRPMKIDWSDNKEVCVFACVRVCERECVYVCV